MNKKRSEVWITDIHNNTSKEFKILLTAKNVFTNKVSHITNNKTNNPRNISIKDTSENVKKTS
jgi:hypothetical protein